nr:hypothetical protein Iba_chr10aCG11820 [Ipomoea batatas]GMD47376.1 hypothetical protein Iba_chr10eCG12350 [Ipomoea batatas]
MPAALSAAAHEEGLEATASSTDMMNVDRPASLRLIPSSDASASLPNIWVSSSSGTPPPVTAENENNPNYDPSMDPKRKAKSKGRLCWKC